MATTTATLTNPTSTKEPSIIISPQQDRPAASISESNATTNSGTPEAPHPIYTPIFLAIYDFLILGIINTFVWGCSTARYLLPLFHANVFGNHLDIGAGTGYYLGCVPASTRLTLVDTEQGALDVAKARSGRHDAEAVVADVLQPLPLRERFASVSMYFVLHGIPATVQEKCGIFDHVKRNMTADGVLHGANVLGKGVREDGFLAAFVRRALTKHGVFHNRDDNAFEFEEALRQNFKRVETWVVGSVFIFRAEGPKEE